MTEAGQPRQPRHCRHCMLGGCPGDCLTGGGPGTASTRSLPCPVPMT